MNGLTAIILGIIQGLAEFIPVSSSGHLVVFQRVFGIENHDRLFDIIVHLGTLVPVLFVFRKDIMELIRRPFQKMTYLIIIATLPAVGAAVFFGDFIDKLFEGGLFLAFGFIVTGLVLIYADSASAKAYKKEKNIGYVDALVVGIAQAVAIAPGISRSGATISASLGRKITKEAAAKFSFLMSIPAILGGLVLEFKSLLTSGLSASSIEVLPLLLGFFAAMLSGYLAVQLLLKLIVNRKLKYFSYYVFAMAAFLLVDGFFLHIWFVF